MSFDWNASFEWFAEQFRQETGLMAPGKDDAMPSDMNERRKAWNEWMGIRRDQAWREWHERHGMLSASAAPAEGRQAVDERAAFDEIRSALDETYLFASTSPRAKENINFISDKLDEIEKARAALATAPTMSEGARDAAMRTVQQLGYTYTEGARQWKPPLGKKPEWLDGGIPPSAARGALECLRDVVSHHENIVAGFAAQRKAAEYANDGDDALYWKREIGVANRMKEQAEHALAEINRANAGEGES